MLNPSGFTQKLNLLNTATFTNLIISSLAASPLISTFQDIAVEIHSCTKECPKLLPLHTPAPSLFLHQKPYGLVFIMLPCLHCSWTRCSTIILCCTSVWTRRSSKIYVCAWFFFLLANVTMPAELRAHIYTYMHTKRKQIMQFPQKLKTGWKGSKINPHFSQQQQRSVR